ncbi:MAG: hypothetical protein N2489_10205 [Clostridia bacterium]|nr:hypothetical protein [Clostridia bacterium]
MPDGMTKKIIVIKDIPSNIIEEAILVLKSENPQKPGGTNSLSNNNLSKRVSNDKSFLMKEAQMIINNCLKEYNLQAAKSMGVNVASKVPGNRFLINAIINVALVGSVALLLFMISRLV